MIIQNFVLSLSDFLTFYFNQINEIQKDVEKRRGQEAAFLFKEDKLPPSVSKITIVELYAHIGQLQKQIKLLSTICFMKKFIDEREGLSDEVTDVKDGRKHLKDEVMTGKTLKSQFQHDI